MIIEKHDDQIIVLMPLPPSVSEAVSHNEDDTYTIVLNENLCPSKRYDAYMHALRHIGHNDFLKSDVQEIESITHSVKGS